MDIAGELSAVVNRIAEISGVSPAFGGVPVERAAPAAASSVVTPAPVGVDGLPHYGPGAAPPAGAGVFAEMVAQALERAKQFGFSGATSAGHAPNPVPPEEIASLVAQNAGTWQVDPALIKAVIANESSFNAAATSPVGAQGLMQLMPETAASLGVRNAYDPSQNVAGGTRYLRSLLDRFGGDMKLAVAAYNAGPGAVEKYGGIPPYAETQNYVSSVLGSYEKYRAK